MAAALDRQDLLLTDAGPPPPGLGLAVLRSVLAVGGTSGQPRLALHILPTRHSNGSNNQQLDYWQWQHAKWRRDL